MSFTRKSLERLQKLVYTGAQRLAHFILGKIAICTDTIASLGLGPIKCRICHFDQFDRVVRIFRKRRYTDTYSYVVRLSVCVSSYDAEFVFFDADSYSLGGDQSLLKLSIEQKGCKFFTAKPRGGVTAA
jgi:hypothetical protein